MDNDKQIPLKFLDEAEDCCDRIESTVLGLADTIADPQALDEALRAAHSVKGGAAMMGFTTLSYVSHQLEDFFKILRVRYHSKSIDTVVETLLLQGLDRLRHAIDLHRHGGSIDEAVLQPSRNRFSLCCASTWESCVLKMKMRCYPRREMSIPPFYYLKVALAKL